MLVSSLDLNAHPRTGSAPLKERIVPSTSARSNRHEGAHVFAALQSERRRSGRRHSPDLLDAFQLDDIRTMTIVMVRSLCLGLAAFAIAGIATQAGEAQGTSRRRGGPRDWSHGRLVATRFGPDQDAAIMRNWRTAMKHRQLDQAKRRRAQQRGLDWVRRFHKRPGHSPDPDASGATLDWNLRTGAFIASRTSIRDRPCATRPTSRSSAAASR